MSHDEYQIHKAKILTPSFWVLLTLTVIGFALIGVRFIWGIGAVSNLSDGYPWGIWITYDVATGTAIACGGYAVAILIYIRNKMHYHPLIRSAVLTSLFGYGLAGFSVMVDVGRPWNAYNFFVPSQWQANSAMFEVALCVMAYTTVLAIEFLPAVLTRLQETNWSRPGLSGEVPWPCRPGYTGGAGEAGKAASAGCLAATQAGQGADLRDCAGDHPAHHAPVIAGVTAADRLHQAASALAHRLSAAAVPDQLHVHRLLHRHSGVGHLLIRLQASLRDRATLRVGLDHPLLTTIWLCVVVGPVWRGQVANALRFDFYSAFFLLEFALVASGSLLLFSKKRRQSPRWLFITAVLIVLGGALYRFNVYLIGFNPGQGWRYFPSLAELLITVGIVAFEILGYQVLVKLFPVLPRLHGHEVVEKA